MTDYATRHLNEVDTAQRVRLTDGHRALGSAPLSVRGGLRPDGGGILSLVPSSMKIKLTTFSADVPGAAAGQGGYPFIHDDASTEYTLLDGDPLGNRIDLVCARVRDNAFDGSGFTDSGIIVIKGNATTGAVPAIPAGCVALWEVGVTATASAGSGGVSVGQDRRLWSVAAGGVLPVASTAERDAASAQVGQVVYNAQTDRLETLRASGWSSAPQIKAGFRDVVHGNSASFTLAQSFGVGVTFAAPPAVAPNIDSGAGATSGWSLRAIDVTTTGFTWFGSGPSASWPDPIRCTYIATAV